MHNSSEYHVTVTLEGPFDDVLVYVTSVTPAGQHQWVADSTFGPGDTSLDLARWLARVLSPLLRMPLR